MQNFKGVFPAIASPCDENDVFLEEKFYTLAENLYIQGVHGLYVCGNTGDGMNMSVEERKKAAEIAVGISKKHCGKVIAHVLDNDYSASFDLAQHASQVGVDAISSMPPVGFEHKRLMKYYKKLANISTLPIFIYYIPHLTGKSSSFEEMVELLDIDGVVGLKITDWNLFFMKRIILSRPSKIVFIGFDELIYPALVYGAHGGIGMWYNLFPGIFTSIYNETTRGNYNFAAELQDKLLCFLSKAWVYGVVQTFETIMRAKGLAPFCFRNRRFYVNEDKQK